MPAQIIELIGGPLDGWRLPIDRAEPPSEIVVSGNGVWLTHEEDGEFLSFRILQPDEAM